MKQLKASPNTCTDTLKLLGDFWTLQIIEALASGELRYCEIQRAIDHVNPVTLADRLRKLEHAQLIDRKLETCDKISVSYGLTKLGRESLPVLDALNTFSSKVETYKPAKKATPSASVSAVTA